MGESTRTSGGAMRRAEPRAQTAAWTRGGRWAVGTWVVAHFMRRTASSGFDSMESREVTVAPRVGQGPGELLPSE